MFRGVYEKSGSTERGETLSLGHAGAHHSEPFKRNSPRNRARGGR